MTLAEAKAYARVVVVAPRTRVDLALPVDVPVVDLLPLLLEMVGERGDDGGGQHGGWQLTLLGGGELPHDRTLRSLDVVDGTALHLAPREAGAAPPVFDDVVDAIATTVRAGMSTRSTNPAAGAAGALVGLLVAAVTLLYRGHGTVNTYLAVAGALVPLAVGAAIARGPGQRVIAACVAAGGLPFAFVAGVDIVPGVVGRSSALLGFALVLLYSLLALPVLGTGTVVFVSSAVIGLFGSGASLVATAWPVRPLYCAAGACALGVAALSVLPWVVVRLARLPLPFVPTTSAELRRSDDLDLEDVTARARLADEYLNGSYVGCSAVIVFSAVIVALHASVLALLLAGACGAALLLRMRSITGLVPRAAMVSAALAGALFGGVGAVTTGAARPTSALFVAAVAIAAGSVLLSVVLPRVRVSPVMVRFVDFVESFVLIAILPLAAGVMNLYSFMRHL